jgi:hypothetical protein
MELNLKINLDNAAYSDEGIGWEIGKAVDYMVSDIGLGLTKGKIRDSNGNTTGHWEIVDQEAEQFVKDHFQFIKIGD